MFEGVNYPDFVFLNVVLLEFVLVLKSDFLETDFVRPEDMKFDILLD